MGAPHALSLARTRLQAYLQEGTTSLKTHNSHTRTQQRVDVSLSRSLSLAASVARSLALWHLLLEVKVHELLYRERLAEAFEVEGGSLALVQEFVDVGDNVVIQRLAARILESRVQLILDTVWCPSQQLLCHFLTLFGGLVAILIHYHLRCQLQERRRLHIGFMILRAEPLELLPALAVAERLPDVNHLLLR